MKKIMLLSFCLFIFFACKNSEERQEEASDYVPPWKEPLDNTRDTKSAVEDIDKERRRQLEEMER